MTLIGILEWLEGHPGLGSWLQAIGTIAALWFAFVQITAGRRLDRRQRAATVRALETAIKTTLDRLDFCERELMRAAQSRDRAQVESTARLVLPDSGLSVGIAALAAISFHELQDWRLVYALVETRAYLDKAQAHLEDLGTEGTRTNPLAFGVAVRGIERGLNEISKVRKETSAPVMQRLQKFVRGRLWKRR